jgi:hypothetical protein
MGIIPQAIAGHGKFLGSDLPSPLTQGLIGQGAKALGKAVNPAKNQTTSDGSLNAKASDAPKSLLG